MCVCPSPHLYPIFILLPKFNPIYYIDIVLHSISINVSKKTNSNEAELS